MFKKLKERLWERIKRNAVESELTYKPNKDSPPITETVYLKRSRMPLIGDWARIYPPVIELPSGKKKILWINLFFGGKKNLVKLLIFGGIIAVVLLGYAELFKYIEILKDNCISPIGIRI